MRTIGNQMLSIGRAGISGKSDTPNKIQHRICIGRQDNPSTTRGRIQISTLALALGVQWAFNISWILVLYLGAAHTLFLERAQYGFLELTFHMAIL